MEWYDAHWWRCWRAARDWLQAARPERLADFDTMVDGLRPVDDLLVRRLDGGVPPQVLASMRASVREVDPVRLESHELDSFGRHVVHDVVGDDVVAWARSVVEPVVGRPLVLAYDFLSLYRGQGRCTPHLDAPNAGYTVDVCLDQSAPWPLLVRDGAPWPPDVDGQVVVPDLDHGDWQEFAMEPGEALLFSGSSVWHGRQPMPDGDGFCTLAFVHLVPADAEDAVAPTRWADLLDVPGLDAAVAAVR